jgi:hypothetical protein
VLDIYNLKSVHTERLSQVGSPLVLIVIFAAAVSLSLSLSHASVPPGRLSQAHADLPVARLPQWRFASGIRLIACASVGREPSGGCLIPAHGRA